jgi:hypothetical protein
MFIAFSRKKALTDVAKVNTLEATNHRKLALLKNSTVTLLSDNETAFSGDNISAKWYQDQAYFERSDFTACCIVCMTRKEHSRVRIPPGYKFFWETMAMLLCVIDLMCSVCVLKKTNKGIGQKNIYLK